MATAPRRNSNERLEATRRVGYELPALHSTNLPHPLLAIFGEDFAELLELTGPMVFRQSWHSLPLRA